MGRRWHDGRLSLTAWGEARRDQTGWRETGLGVPAARARSRRCLRRGEHREAEREPRRCWAGSRTGWSCRGGALPTGSISLASGDGWEESSTRTTRISSKHSRLKSTSGRPNTKILSMTETSLPRQKVLTNCRGEMSIHRARAASLPFALHRAIFPVTKSNKK